MSTESAPANAGDAKKIVRGHGLPIPTINLKRALELAEIIWNHEKRNAAPVSAVIVHWGLGAKSSAGFQSVASLKRFGLVEEIGSGERRALKLTALALDLLKNKEIDQPKFEEDLKRAAMLPKAHQVLWGKFGAELPSDATLKSYLTFELEFSDVAASQFIKVYKDTIEYAKITDSDVMSEETDPWSDSDGSAIQEEVREEDFPSTVPSREKREQGSSPVNSIGAKPAPPVSTGLRYLSIPLDIGDAPIPVGMSEEDFELLLQTLQLWKRKIVKAQDDV